MSWLGLADQKERRFSLRGIGHDRQEHRRHPSSSQALLTRGSIVFEAHIAPDRRPHTLCGYKSTRHGPHSLTFQAIPGGGIAMVQVCGDAIAHGAVQHETPARTDSLRVTFAWECARDWAQLSVERPGVRQVSSTIVHNIRPLRVCDVQDFVMGRAHQAFSTDMIYAAVSDTVEPVGPTPSVQQDAMVEVANGFIRIGDLRRGDTVRTQRGDLVPVLHRVDRIVPARGSFAPVGLRAPYFGLLSDVIVSPDQRLVIGGSEVEYLFNEEAVLVPARHLKNGFVARDAVAGPTVKYSQLILPGHDAMRVAGTIMESLYVGRLRRKPDLLRTTLLRDLDRNSLPEHGRPVFKELQWYDAIHLARQRVA